jgi:hypoxanthine phosphoribosyltransferase
MGIPASQNKEILIRREAIEQRVHELALKISQDYAGSALLVVGVLKGAFVFLADLIRQMTIPCEVDFVRLASYGAGTVSFGDVMLTKDIEGSIEHRDVLIVEDILDTGRTMAKLVEIFSQRNPISLKVCTFLDKEGHRSVPFRADYVGFTIENFFVVGYGLDCNEKDRSLPDVYVIKE